jgi:MFS family permease
MADIRSVSFGFWRAVLVLAATQILAWGTIYYTPVLTVPLIAADHGWSRTFAMGGFSLGILMTGLASPYVGILVDRYGGHVVMPVGSLLGATGLAALSATDHPAVYLAVWALLGVAMASSLYDPAFASLGRIFGTEARRPITVLTFVAGLASTISWPTTSALIGWVGWRETYLIYAALLAFIAAPLHAFALPRSRALTDVVVSDAAAKAAPVLPARGLTFILVVAAFACFAFVPSGLLAHLLAIFERFGIDHTTAVAIGTLFGPCQVAARLCEFIFARGVHPVTIARFAVGLLLLGFIMLGVFGLSAVIAAAFMLLLGLANGLMTIARGTVPLALFGASNYGRLIGRIAGPSLVVQSSAPLILAFVAERVSDPTALMLAAAMATISLACFFAIRPRSHIVS